MIKPLFRSIFQLSLLLALPIYMVSVSAFADDDSAGAQADMLIQQMTLDQKIQLTHGGIGCDGSFNGAIIGIPALNIPDLYPTDSPSGVRLNGCPGNPNYPGPSTTDLPVSLALTASFDPVLGQTYGNLIGQEIHDIGYQWNLGGNVNLVRDPRGGRTFETMGEDPILAGVMVAKVLTAIQENGVIASLKHFALNDQETNRFFVNGLISERGMRESDLLAFEIGLKESGTLSVMCSYNLINGIHGCSNNHLMNDILKGEWRFTGFIHSDYLFGTHSVTDANAGLDVDEPGISFLPLFGFPDPSFVSTLKPAVLSNVVPLTRLNDMVHRILSVMIKIDLLNNPPIAMLIDQNRGNAVAQQVEEQGAVLLKNDNQLLPLSTNRLHTIAVIGSNADIAVLNGGGSGDVTPVGGFANVPATVTSNRLYNFWCLQYPIFCMKWAPSSPLNAIRTLAPNTVVTFNSGLNPAEAAALASQSDVAIVFVHSWTGESFDATSLSAASGFLGLPCSSLSSPCVDQDQLVSQVAAANPRTIVVLESGSALLMPWLNHVGAVLESWYPGIKGGEAIANILFGVVNPSGKLPITFPMSESDLPRPASPTTTCRHIFCLPTSTVDYNIEQQNVGYKWFDSQNKPVLFPFGYGLSYTTFSYSNIHTTPVVTDGTNPIRVSFKLTNTGNVAGAEVAEVYLGLPSAAGEAPKRYVGSQKVFLQPGETEEVTVILHPKSPEHPLSFWNINKGPQGGFGAWDIADGQYQVYVGTSSRNISLNDVITVHHSDDK